MKENALLKQANNKALENAPVIIALYDTQNRIVWGNKFYRDAFSVTLAEIEGQKCHSVWELDQPCHDCSVIKAIETGNPVETSFTPHNQNNWPESKGS